MTCARIQRYGDTVRTDGWEGMFGQTKDCVHKSDCVLLRSLIASGCVL